MRSVVVAATGTTGDCDDDDDGGDGDAAARGAVGFRCWNRASTRSPLTRDWRLGPSSTSDDDDRRRHRRRRHRRAGRCRVSTTPSNGRWRRLGCGCRRVKSFRRSDRGDLPKTTPPVGRRPAAEA